MIVYWRCLGCEETGEGDKAAERHTKQIGHATVTGVRSMRADPQPDPDVRR